MNCCERDPQMAEHSHSGVPDLRTVLLLMREMRAVRVKLPGLEAELSPLAFAMPAVDLSQAPAPIGVENGGEPTDEQLLQWSAPGPLPSAIQPEAQ